MAKSEDDPLDPKPVAAAIESRRAMNYLDDVVLAGGGIALRYGIFNGGMIKPVCKRQLPIVGGGFLSWIHLDDAAAATVLAPGWSLRYPSWRQGFVEVYATLLASMSEPRPPRPADVAGARSSAR